MALEDELMDDEEETLGEEEEKDLDIMVSMAENMIDESGSDIIQQALNSKDPGVILGQFLMQLGSQLAERLPFDVSPRIMLARGGWLEQVSDYLQDEYDVPQKIMDRAEIFVASSAQQMSQSQQQAPQQPPQQAAPEVPQEVM